MWHYTYDDIRARCRFPAVFMYTTRFLIFFSSAPRLLTPVLFRTILLHIIFYFRGAINFYFRNSILNVDAYTRINSPLNAESLLLHDCRVIILKKSNQIIERIRNGDFARLFCFFFFYRKRRRVKFKWGKFIIIWY